MLYHTNVSCDNILDKFEFEHSRAKAKVTMAILRKKIFSLLLRLYLWIDFNFTSHKHEISIS